MIRAIIFDLDSCLAAADEAGRDLFEPAFEAIRQASRGSHSPKTLERAFEETWRVAFDAVAEKYGFSKEMRDAGWEHFRSLEVTKPLGGYGDLHVLSELSADLFLVTSGFRRLQSSKVRMLGVESIFKGVYVDAIDELGRIGKKGIFENILRENRLEPAEVLVVGDNPDTEIKVGRELGMRTVQTLRPGVPGSDKTDWRIRGLGELKTLLSELNA